CFLGDAVDAVEAVGQLDAVAVKDGRFRQLVVQDNSDPVAFGGLDSGPGHAVVVATDVHPRAGQEFAARVLGDEVKFLDAVDDLPGQPGQVRGHDRHRRLGGVPQAGHEFTAVRGAAHGTARAGPVARV